MFFNLILLKLSSTPITQRSNDNAAFAIEPDPIKKSATKSTEWLLFSIICLNISIPSCPVYGHKKPARWRVSNVFMYVIRLAMQLCAAYPELNQFVRQNSINFYVNFVRHRYIKHKLGDLQPIFNTPLTCSKAPLWVSFM